MVAAAAIAGCEIDGLHDASHDHETEATNDAGTVSKYETNGGHEHSENEEHDDHHTDTPQIPSEIPEKVRHMIDTAMRATVCEGSQEYILRIHEPIFSFPPTDYIGISPTIQCVTNGATTSLAVYGHTQDTLTLQSLTAETDNNTDGYVRLTNVQGTPDLYIDQVDIEDVSQQGVPQVKPTSIDIHPQTNGSCIIVDRNDPNNALVAQNCAKIISSIIEQLYQNWPTIE